MTGPPNGNRRFLSRRTDLNPFYQPEQGRSSMPTNHISLRIVLAKVGLDGHDRGIKVVARALRDAGMEVIYAGLWQTPEAVIRTVADEDADWLGLSLLSGAHLTLVPRVLEMLRRAGLEHVGVIVGGIIPEGDVPKLLDMGVARVFGPGTALPEIVAFLHEGREGTAPLSGVGHA
jgi:methylmalonyl-CoA mutase cobalamin-binding domain/chain